MSTRSRPRQYRSRTSWISARAFNSSRVIAISCLDKIKICSFDSRDLLQTSPRGPSNRYSACRGCCGQIARAAAKQVLRALRRNNRQLDKTRTIRPGVDRVPRAVVVRRVIAVAGAVIHPVERLNLNADPADLAA